MKKVLLLLTILINTSVFAQDSTESTTNVNAVYKEMQAMKKAYYEGLRDEKKSKIDNINKAREINRKQKLTEVRQNSSAKLNATKTERQASKNDRLAQIQLKKKQRLLKEWLIR